MADSDSSAVNWTLLFKNHNITILLIVAPTQSIASVKEMLHNALKVRNIPDINGDPVPETASGVELGVPIDRTDLDQGWKKLEVPAQETKDGDKKRVVGGRKSVLNMSVQGADIQDSEVIAFRFREAEDDKEKDELEKQLDDPGWDVIIPAYEDDEGIEC